MAEPGVFSHDNGELEAVFTKVKERYFEDDPINEAVIKYVFFEAPKKDRLGKVMLGEARIPTKRERDLFGPLDFYISIYYDYWAEADLKDKIRLAWHELHHCVVVTNKKGDVAYDDQGRLKVKIRPHDIVMEFFGEEIKRFGLPNDEYSEVSDVFHTADHHMQSAAQKRMKK